MQNASAVNEVPRAMNHVSQSPNGCAKAAKLFDGLPKLGAGIYDGLSAMIAAKWKFEFLWVSSFSYSGATGLTDVGIIGPEEMLTIVRTAGRLTQLPIVVDLDP